MVGNSQTNSMFVMFLLALSFVVRYLLESAVVLLKVLDNPFVYSEEQLTNVNHSIICPLICIGILANCRVADLTININPTRFRLVKCCMSMGEIFEMS